MDDLRSALESAVEEHSEPETPSAPVETVAPVATPESASPAPSQDDGGEAAPAASTAERRSPDAPKSIEEVANEPVVDKPADKPGADPRVDRAPQSWKGDAKKVWAELPLNVRQEVARRERETSRVLQETAEVRQKVETIQTTLAPHMDRINAMYQGNPITAINNLLGVERILVNGDPVAKVNLVANMIKHFGIDLVSLDKALVGEAPSPEVQQQSNIEKLLEQKLAPFQQFIQSQQQREQQQRAQVEQEVVHTVESMSSDPQFPYFNEVRELMADIVELNSRRGIYITLPEAYNKAIRMNDETYQASSGRESSQAATQAALQAHQAAQKAKGAAVSVSGSPSMPGGNSGNPSDLRGTISSLLGETGNRI
jgi:HPt (histidine-containing phosphotransfer) domain-containing protein